MNTILMLQNQIMRNVTMNEEPIKELKRLVTFFWSNRTAISEGEFFNTLETYIDFQKSTLKYNKINFGGGKK